MIIPACAYPGALGWGTAMRSSITQFAVRVVVAIGIAFVAVSVIGSAVAYSAVERARMIVQETITKSLRSPAPKTEFRLSDHQQLRKIFLGR